MSLIVVLATHNAHKVAEFQKILGAELPGLEVLPYDGPEPVEDGVTFADNALIKARTAARHTGHIALADDSGISVDVLGGSPGIFSARWSGTRDDETNRRLLLAQIADMSSEHRRAHFHCAIALVVPDGTADAGLEHVAHGDWPGAIATEEHGENGFGYDPVFVPEGFEVTAAQLSPGQKNEISHRARAFRALVPVLARLDGGTAVLSE
ncbi:XTP/dITP diphosphohydrolase [Paramicrobacterium humi]|uniref:dITP/XTP pyrophosphatase n=1 Tax=Paramicrobacterium humi TaxID=640635 RepID=A0A1H4TC63_9MICO|nr:RdgB/HAM1 family non-canonical purine NTP pyrophosphatase [Microbacterium humi]SEC54032.1 XTP/dITP diphosphohydrolase [Microbacterium humi]